MGREWPPYASARSSRVHDSASSRRRRSQPTRAELPSALCPLPSALCPLGPRGARRLPGQGRRLGSLPLRFRSCRSRCPRSPRSTCCASSSRSCEISSAAPTARVGPTIRCVAAAAPPTRARSLGRSALRLTPRVPRTARRRWARFTPSARSSWRRGARAAGTLISWVARGGAARQVTMPTSWCGTSRRRRAGAAAGRTARSGCSPMCSRLQPRVYRGCNPMCSEAAALCSGRPHCGRGERREERSLTPTLTRRHCVLGLLLDELERLGRLVPQQGGW